MGDEDCLFLNVWAHDNDTERPVIVFLHGGVGNGVGGDMPASEGTSLAEHADVIVVTLNRPMGALGGLAIEELIAENPRTTAGSYAVLDMIAAASISLDATMRQSFPHSCRPPSDAQTVRPARV